MNIAELAHFENNLNRVYMALLMAAPMVVVMLIVMRSMFESRRLSYALLAGAVAAAAILIGLIRSQTPIGNVQFLRSMIPHHSSAILMCERSGITDGQIERLCEQIVRSQEEEIAEMQRILSRL